jgi:hypothetical protein
MWSNIISPSDPEAAPSAHIWSVVSSPEVQEEWWSKLIANNF